MRKLFLFILILLLIGCVEKPQFFEYRSAGNGKWHQDSVLNYDVYVPHAKIPYDLELFVRHGLKYKYRNLWLQVEIESPRGEIISNKLEMMLVDKKGFWKGTSVSAIVDYHAKLDKLVLNDTGVYKWRISHLMTDTVLADINDIGFSLTINKNGEK